MAKKENKECELMHLTISNLVEQHNVISKKITNALGKAKGTYTSKLSKCLDSSRDVKEIFVMLLFFLETLFLTKNMFNVNIKKFEENTEALLEECHVSCSMDRFQEYYHHRYYKIGKRDGQPYISLGLEERPVLWCDDLIPLLEKLVKMISKILNNHYSSCKKGTSKCKVCLRKRDLTNKLQHISSFSSQTKAVNNENAGQAEPGGQIGYNEFVEKIKNKFDSLKEYKVKNLKKPKGKTNHCLIYRNQKGEIKHTFFNDTARSLKWGYDNRRLLEKELPVILTTNNYNSSHHQAVRKKKGGEGIVGREFTPNVPAIINIPNIKCEPQPRKFYLDTGADAGSVGYNYEFLQDFIFSMEEIECEEKPVVFGQISVQNHDFQEIQTFDVDRDPAWNALGMEQIKHFTLFSMNKLCLLVNPEDVELKDCGIHVKIEISITESDQIQLINQSKQAERSSLVGTNPVPEANKDGLQQSDGDAGLQETVTTSPEIVADTNAVLRSVDKSSEVESESEPIPAHVALTL